MLPRPADSARVTGLGHKRTSVVGIGMPRLFPANWQIRELFNAIGDSALTDDGFRFRTDEKHHRLNWMHTGFNDAYFLVEWRPFKPDIAGYGGPGPEGEYHVRMAPAGIVNLMAPGRS